MRIYLAGKVNGEKHRFKAFFPEHTFLYSDGNDHSEHSWGASWGYGGHKEEVNTKAIAMLQSADFLIAYLDKPDSYGSIAEIGYFSALKKKSLVLINTPKEPIEFIKFENIGNTPLSETDRFYDAYWFVSSFPGVVVHEIKTLKEALKLIIEAI